MDYRLSMMCGNDIPVPQCQITVHQPRIKEIGMIGEQDFFIGAQCLTINSSMFIQDKALLPELNNFQIFMTIMNEKESRDKKNSTLQVLEILFPHHKPMFTPRSLILNKEGGQVLIDENNFDSLQEILRMVFCTKTCTPLLNVPQYNAVGMPVTPFSARCCSVWYSFSNSASISLLSLALQ